MNTKPKLDFEAIQIHRHPLIEKDAIFSTLATSRVAEDDLDVLTNLQSNLYRNNVIAITGKNATGKTTLLNLLLGVLQLTLNNKSIENTDLTNILLDEDVELSIFFYSETQKIYRDHITFTKGEHNDWFISKEVIMSKKLNKHIVKKDILNFDDDNVKITIEYDRNHLEGIERQLLSADASLFRLISAQHDTQYGYNTLRFTNFNGVLYKPYDVPAELLEFLDPTIEFFKMDIISGEDSASRISYKLKFKNRDEVYSDTNFSNLAQYLSSGTIKAITMHSLMLKALQTGSIFIMDEIENHYNNTIIREIIEVFSNPYFNVHGATLIFSTHFSELLNDIKRMDNIYIMEREDKIAMKKYSELGIRSELDKQEVFDSGYNMKSTPSYEAIVNYEQALKESIINHE